MHITFLITQDFAHQLGETICHGLIIRLVFLYSTNLNVDTIKCALHQVLYAYLITLACRPSVLNPSFFCFLFSTRNGVCVRSSQAQGATCSSDIFSSVSKWRLFTERSNIYFTQFRWIFKELCPFPMDFTLCRTLAFLACWISVFFFV